MGTLYGSKGQGWYQDQSRLELGSEIANRAAANRNKPAAPAPPPPSRLAGVLGAIGRGVAQPFQRVSTGIARALPGGTADIDAQRKANTRLAKSEAEIRKRTKGLSKEKRTKLEQALASAEVRQATEGRKQLEDQTNKGKFVAAAYEVGLTPLMLSPSGLTKGAGVTGRVLSGASKTVKGAEMSKKARVGYEVAENVAGATLSAAQSDNFTPKEVAQNAAIGTAIPLAGTVIRQGARAVKATDGALSKGVSKATSSIPGSGKVKSAIDSAVIKIQNNQKAVSRALGDSVDEKFGLRRSEVADQLRANVKKSEGQARAIYKPEVEKLATFFKGDKKKYKEITEAISNYQNAINARKLGKDVELPKLTPEQQAAYRQLNQSTKPVIQAAFDGGLIDKAKYDKWMADPDYTRVQREVDETLDQYAKSGGYQIKKTVTDQRLKGGKGSAIDPVAAYIDWSRKVIKEVNRNQYTKYVTESLQEVGGTAKKLRDSDKVVARMQAYGEAAQLRPLRDKLEKALTGQSKYVAQIQRELKQIKNEALGEVEKKLTKATKNGLVPEGGATPENIKGVIDEILNTDTATLNRLNKKFLNREPKLAEALTDLTKIKTQYDEAAGEVSRLVQAARRLKDERGLPDNVVGQFEKGIKELVEVEPEVARALKNVRDVELGAIARWLAMPGRLLRAGATSANPAFIIPNFVRDQLSSGILSKSMRDTHNPVNFFMALKTANKGLVGAESGLSENFQKYLKFNSNMTSFDLARNLKKATQEAAELSGLKGSRINSTARKLEDVMGSTEVATRYQNWLGTYQKAVKDGLGEEAALMKANVAARKNSIDFSQEGEWTSFLRYFNPYINAQIQGAAQLGEAFKLRPAATSIKIGATLMAPTAGLVYWNLSDPNRARTYANIPEAEKDGNLIFVLGDGSKGYLKLPTPPGINEMVKPLRNLVESEYLGDRQSFLETAKNLLVDPFNPLGGTKSQVLGSMIPQAIKPGVEIGTNYNFFYGNKIVPDNLKDKPAEEQVYNKTSQGYRDIAKILGVSPLQVKSALRGYTAGTGEATVENVDFVRNKLNPNVKTGGRTTAEQISGRFYESTPETGDVTRKFYKDYNTVKSKKTNVSDKINEAIAKNDINKARSLADSYNKQVEQAEKRFKSSYGKYEKDSDLLNTLNKLKINLSDRSIKQRRTRIEKGK